jgi:transcriptional adapter 2-alpha
MQAAEKKRPKEDKEILHRLRPFAKLQTAEDYEQFCADILYEAMLRKRIADLQQYRRLGITNAADLQQFEEDSRKRVRTFFGSASLTLTLSSVTDPVQDNTIA